MKISNEVTNLFKIEYPIIQAGMVWVSGWKLASAVSNNGGVGLIGAGSMKPELLREHIRNCINATDKPFGVNIPLLRGDAEKLVNVTIEENVKIVFTSAGHPGKFIDILKKNDITVVHVVPSLKFAKKAESVGCDAIVGEGVEAGGHNGADEITTFCLIPELVDSLNIPVIAAGGIADGRGILAALSLGAEGVQIGTRFAATVESSAHPNYKKTLLEARENDTVLILKKVGLTRVIKNRFSDSAVQLEQSGSRKEELLNLLGEKREQLGIFEGDLNNGMIEAGQGIGQIDKILTVKELFKKLITELENSFQSLKNEIT
ncbi:nitronate monooxygenase [bacterium BMS3Abin04]|nr:nitronate monooxygenase [bacterium BMS3Abin04]